MGNLLDRMEPLLAAMPAVKSPEGHVHFKNKLLWTLAILILYFALTNIPVFGLSPANQDLFAAWRALLAGASGSIIHLGIGPIVTASIVLQLLKGADILHIDTSETRGQVMYMGLQKLLILVMIIIEAAPNLVGGFMIPDPVIASQFFGGNLFAVSILIFIQICIGGVLIFFMDEVVTNGVSVPVLVSSLLPVSRRHLSAGSSAGPRSPTSIRQVFSHVSLLSALMAEIT